MELEGRGGKGQCKRIRRFMLSVEMEEFALTLAIETQTASLRTERQQPRRRSRGPRRQKWCGSYWLKLEYSFMPTIRINSAADPAPQILSQGWILFILTITSSCSLAMWAS